ncbi:unnamed protein product [Urochloa humidicola]
MIGMGAAQSPTPSVIFEVEDRQGMGRGGKTHGILEEEQGFGKEAHQQRQSECLKLEESYKRKKRQASDNENLKSQVQSDVWHSLLCWRQVEMKAGAHL